MSERTNPTAARAMTGRAVSPAIALQAKEVTAR